MIVAKIHSMLKYASPSILLKCKVEFATLHSFMIT